MESIENGKAALIASIESDAHIEEKKIISDAEAQALEKKEYADKKVESILKQADEKAKEEADAIKRKIISDVDLEIKRRFLRLKGTIIQDITDRVEKKLGSMMEDAGYRGVLADWIAEAALGLDVESAKINASEKERKLIDDQLLLQVKEKVGEEIKLSVSDEKPLQYQGVIVTAANGRVAFNNQVKTRMLRNQRKIQTLISKALFSGTHFNLKA